MAITGSGEIRFSDIRSELGLSGQVSYDSTEFRGLVGISSGAVRISDFYGLSAGGGGGGSSDPGLGDGGQADNSTLANSIETFTWNRSSGNTNEELVFTYTFPPATPTGNYYLAVWNDYNRSNTNPTATTSYRTRRIFSLMVVSNYDFAAREPTVPDHPSSISGSGSFERIAEVRIRNATRTQDMANVSPGQTVDVQYHTANNTVMVVPGDTIEIYMVLQGPYSEFTQWSHNAI